MIGGSRFLILAVVIAVLMTLFSCGNRLWKKNFHVYKSNPLQQATVAVPAEGIFFLENYRRPRYWDPPFAFLLYKDGSVVSFNSTGISDVPESDFWQRPEDFMKSIRASAGRDEGHYKIKGDSITMEIFITHVGSFVQQNVIRFIGRVANDSTITIEKAVCGWCPKKISFFPTDGIQTSDGMRYRFYPTSIRPPANDRWFGDEKWYKKNAWYNRKLQ